MKISLKKIVLKSILITVFTFATVLPITINAPIAADGSGLPSEYTLLEPLHCIKSDNVNCTEGTPIEKVEFRTYVEYMFNLLIALAAVSAVFMIVWGGFEYMTSDSWTGKKDGLGKAKNAIYGLILVLCSFLILRTVDPRLTAIPNTLVTPLNLDYERIKNQNNQFYNDLNNNARDHGADTTELRDKNAQNQRNVEGLQNNWNDLQNQINNLDPKKVEDAKKIEELQKQQDEIAEKVRAESTTAIVQTDQAIITSELNIALNVDPTTIDKAKYISQMNSYKTEIQDSYRAALVDLGMISNPPDPAKVRDLQTVRDYAVTLIEEKIKLAR